MQKSNLIICRPVDQMLSPSWLSPGWFVAQLTFAQLVVAQLTGDQMHRSLNTCLKKKIVYTKAHGQCSNCSKTASGVERRKRSNGGTRAMWHREGTLLDPTVVGGGAPLLQRFLISKRHTFVNCYALKVVFITISCQNPYTIHMGCIVYG